MTLVVQVRNSALQRVAEVEDFSALTLTLRHAKPSAWLLDLPMESDAAQMIALDGGLVVTRNGATLLSGPVRSWNQTVQDGIRRMTVSGVDDTDNLDGRLGLPVPTGPPYTAFEHDDFNALAETVMRYYVDRNLGPTAPVARRLANFTVPATTGLGTTVRGKARYINLLELVQQLALAGGDLGFTISQVGSALQFNVYAPVDRSATAVFSEEIGNLNGFSYGQTAPKGNYFYVAGGGEGTARVIVEVSDAASIAAYGRIEQFRDRRDTSDITTLTETGTAELAENAGRTSLEISPVDTPAIAYGTHYNVGDKVKVLIDGAPIIDVIRQVTLTYSADRGEVVTPLVGEAGAQVPGLPGVFETMRRTKRRLSNLERR